MMTPEQARRTSSNARLEGYDSLRRTVAKAVARAAKEGEFFARVEVLSCPPGAIERVIETLDAEGYCVRGPDEDAVIEISWEQP